MKEIEDCCEDWTENIPKVNAPLELQHARNPAFKGYDGVLFRYCPWCGKERPKVEE